MLIFMSAGESWALPASDVVEIIRPPAMTRVPHSAADLLGVANVRGVVLPIVSFNSLLGNDAAPTSRSTRVIVVKNRTLVGLLVDAVTTLTKSPDGKQIDLNVLLDKNFRSRKRPETRRSADAQSSKATREEVQEELVFIAFVLASQEYALPLDQIVSIAPLPDTVAGLPRTDQAMIGVAQVAGSLVPIVSARALLGFACQEMDRARSRIILIKLGDGLVALVVDGVNEILRIQSDSLDTVPPVLTRGRGEAQIEAIGRLDEGRRLISILAPTKLFDAETTTRILAQTNVKAPQMNSDENGMEGAEQFVVFQLGNEFYGLPIGSVDEIVRCPDNLTRVPRAPGFVRGLMNLRGKAVPIIDQRERFSAPPEKEGGRRRIVVVTIDGLQAGFLVDKVREVLTVSGSDLSPTPELSDSDSHVVARIAMIEREGQMILLVDPKALLDHAERDMLSAISSEDAHKS